MLLRLSLPALTAICLVVLSRPVSASPGDIDPSFNASPNLDVRAAVTLRGGQILAGGDFTTIGGAAQKYLARLNPDGSADPAYSPVVNAYVQRIARMPDGKVVITGGFATVNGVPRARIARLNPDGSLDEGFNPGCSAVAGCLAALPDGKLLVGGNFTSIAGQNRSFLARLNPDGTADDSFNPAADSVVQTIVLQPDGNILVGGGFSNIGGQARTSLARLLPGGLVDPSFTAATNSGGVNALAIQPDGRILVGGSFSTLSGTPRENIGRIFGDGSIDNSFQAHATGTVSFLSLQADGRIFLNCNSSVNGESRSGLAKLEPNGDLDPSFNPAFESAVAGMAIQEDGRILVYGGYQSVAGVTQSRLLRLENQAASTAVERQAASVRWLRGGGCPEFGRVMVEVFAAGSSGTWSPAIEAVRIPGGWSASPLLPAVGTLRFRGMSANGASWDAESLLTIGDAQPQIALEDLSGAPIAGTFDLGSALGGNQRTASLRIRNTGAGVMRGLAAAVTGANAADFTVVGAPFPDLAPGEASILKVRFSPGATGSRLASLQLLASGASPAVLALSGHGAGSTLAPAPVFGITKGPLITSEGFTASGLSFGTLVLDAAPAPGEVFTVVNNTSAVAIGGTFADLAAEAVVTASFGGQSYSFMAGYRGGDGNDLVLTRIGTGSPLAPLVSFASGVEQVVPAPDGKFLVTAALVSDVSQTRSGLVRLNRDGSIDASFNSPFLPSFEPVRTMTVQADGGILATASSFSIYSGSLISRFSADGTFDQSFNSKVFSIGEFYGSPVFSVAVQTDGKILLGGGFVKSSGSLRHLIRLNADGSLDQAFQPNPGGVVNSVVVQPDGKILVGGSFTTMGGQTRNRVARLEANGALDPSFNPNADAVVDVIGLLPGGEILLAGSFQTLDGVAHNRIAKLLANGTPDPAFNPAPNGLVRCFAQQTDGKIVIGGSFTELAGVPRTRIARLLPDGSVDGTFNSSAGATVESLALTADGSLLIGGAFTSAGGVSRSGLARLANDPATTAVEISSPGSARWMLGGSAAELSAAQIQIMPQGQATWSAPVNATRIPGGWEAVGLSLPPQGIGRWQGKTVAGGEGGSTGVAETLFDLGDGTPEIEVRDPAGAGLQNGSANLDFGSLFTGHRTTLTLRISNAGDGLLEGVLASIQGPAAGSFSITRQPQALNVPAGSTELSVRFLPTTAGPKSATLSIASNDPDEAPFTIALSGTASSTVFSPVFNYAGQQTVAAVGFDASSLNFGSLTLNAAPTAGTVWRALDNASSSAFFGRFQNLPEGAIVSASYQGVQYHFRASYSGGTGNDLVFSLTGPGDLDPDFAANADASVNALALQPDGKILIGGGNFAKDGVGPDYFARLLTNGKIDESFNPAVDGTVYAVSLQGNGDMFVGGSFFRVNGLTRQNLVKLHGDGSLDSNFNYSGGFAGITCIAPAPGGGLYLGSGSTTSNGVSQTAIRRVNSYGSLDSSFSAMVIPAVSSLAVQSDGKVLIGGSFTTVNGIPWKGIARLNADGSLDATFNPDADGNVYSLAIQPDGKILAGGNFDVIGGASRPKLARLLTDGTADPGFQAADRGEVRSLLLQADGGVTTAGSATASMPAVTRVTSSGAADPSFGNGVSSQAYGIAAQADGRILVAGFAAISGQTRYLYRLQGSASPSNLAVPDPSSIVWSQGGAFPELASVHFQRFTPGTSDPIGIAAPTRFAEGWRTTGLSLPISGIVGARGTTIGGQGGSSRGVVERYVNYGGIAPVMKITGPQAQILASDSGVIDGGAALNGNSRLNAFVIANQGAGYLGDFSCRITGPQAAEFALADHPPTLLPGQSGSLKVRFSPQAAGTRLATLEITSNASPNPFLIQLAGTGQGAEFSPHFADAAQAGAVYPGFKATGISLGEVTLGFAPAPGTILKLIDNTATTALEGSFANLVEGSIVSARFGTQFYDFAFSYKGGTGNDPILLLKNPGTVEPGYAPVIERYSWSGTPINVLDGFVPLPDGKTLITGGFDRVNVSSFQNLARLGTSGSTDPSLEVYATGTRCAALQPDGWMVIGGSFTYLQSKQRRGVARLSRYGALDPAFDPNVQGGEVRSITLLPDGKILIAGSFTSVGGASRPGIARLHPGGTLDTGFDANVAGGVNSVTVEAGGSILIGGSFFQVGGVARQYLARIGTNGALQAAFNPNPDAAVSSVLVQADGRVLVGGDFTTIAGVTNRGYARLLSGGASDGSPPLGLNGGVQAISLQADGRILLAGTFTSVAGQARQQVARLNPDGSPDPTFAFAGANAGVSGLALDGEGRILIGGSFSRAEPFERKALARLYNDPAISDFQMTGPSALRWSRGGSAPEARRVYFETSANGYEWTSLGEAARAGGAWEALDLDLAGGTRVRARAVIAGGLYAGSSGLVESQVLTVPLNDLEIWRAARFGSAANSGEGADEADADYDGLPNLLEYATGGDPLLAGENPVKLEDGILFRLLYPRSTAALAAGTRFVVEWSDTLGAASWSTAGVTESVIGGTAELPLVRATIPHDGARRRLARLRVLAP